MTLSRSELGPDPIAALRQWVADARDSRLGDEPVVTLATIDHMGAPDARLVVVRSIGQEGITFYNDARSPKGRQLAKEPRAAMVAYWEALGRQVRVRGNVTILAPGVSDVAFHSRERRSQIGYWVNEQSAPIRDRAALEKNLDDGTRKLNDKELTRPDYWVVYSLRPEFIEFWQAGDRHLHDRIKYTLVNEDWHAERLQP